MLELKPQQEQPQLPKPKLKCAACGKKIEITKKTRRITLAKPPDQLVRMHVCNMKCAEEMESRMERITIPADPEKKTSE